MSSERTSAGSSNLAVLIIKDTFLSILTGTAVQDLDPGSEGLRSILAMSAAE